MQLLCTSDRNVVETNTHNVGLRSTEEAGPERALPLAELKWGTEDMNGGQRVEGEAPGEAGQGQ